MVQGFKGLLSGEPYWLAFDLQRFADEEERSEPATPRRREEARSKGQVAKTQELGTALVLLAGAASLYYAGAGIIRDVGQMMSSALAGQLAPRELTLPVAVEMFRTLTWRALLLMLPVSLIMAAAGLASQLVQVGFLVTGYPLQPSLERINPLAGFQRIFSRRALVEMVKALMKLAIVAGIGFSSLRAAVSRLPHLLETAPLAAASWVGQVLWRMTLTTGLALLSVALVDYIYQRSEHEKNLRMSKKQLRDEYRQTEGDPLVRRRIRERQRQLASRRMMQAVPTADVVITNPTHLAVALKYDMATMESPIVVAKGSGTLAQRIREIAREHGVVVVEDRWLARALYEGVEVGQAIPEELYQAVARVLAFVYRLRGYRLPEGGGVR